MKGYGKRIVAAVLIVALLTTLLSAVPKGDSYYAAASELSKRLDKSENRIRGVVDNLSDVPTTERATLGTPGYPFLVLEIVPYEEYAEFGYLIDGCEPVNIHDIFVDRIIDNDFNVIETLAKLGTAEIKSLGAVYFFDGEDEEYAEYFDDEGNRKARVTDYTGKVYGYFEKVGSGNGDWIVVPSEEPSVSSGNAGSVTSGNAEDSASGNTGDDVQSGNAGTGQDVVSGIEGSGTEQGTVPGTEGSGTEQDTVPGTESSGAEQSTVPGTEESRTEQGTVPGTEGSGTEQGTVPGTEGSGTEQGTVPGTESSGAEQNTILDTENPESEQNMTGRNRPDDMDQVQGESEVQSAHVHRTAMAAKELHIVLTISEGVEAPESENETTEESGSNGSAGSDANKNEDANENDNVDLGGSDENLQSGEEPGATGGFDGAEEPGATGGSGGAEEPRAAGGSDDAEESGAMEEVPTEEEAVTSDEETNERLQTRTASGVFPFKKVDFGEGDWIWHTFSDAEREAHEVSGEFQDPDNLVLDESCEEGHKVFTWRIPTDGQCIQVQDYYTYKNNDLFLRQSLLLKDEDVENYSIVVKTITPVELIKQPGWIDRANLIYLSSARHGESTTEDQPDHKDSELAKIWGADGNGNGYGYGWLFRENSESHPYTGKPAAYTENDLDWVTTEKLYRKVANQPVDSYSGEWEPDYAALIMDDYIYNPDSGLFGNPLSNISISVYDWNLIKTGSWTIKKGSSNNIYKMGIMLMAMDTSLFTNLYLNPVNGNTSAYIDSTGKNTLQAGNAQTYWSVETFLLDATYRLADYDSLELYWKSSELWNYHSTIDPTAGEYRYWVNDHVFTCPGGKGILTSYDESFANTLSNTDNYKQLFSEFSEYAQSLPALASLKKGTLVGTVQVTDGLCPAYAVRYILRDIQQVKTKLETKTEKEKAEEAERLTINVLDLEPSVEIDGNGTPQWFLKETYVQMMVGGYDGNINITHQTTMEFIGKTEDLVSEYQLIYLGLDDNAYTKGNATVTVRNKSVTMQLPQWNDKTHLGNRIYTHSGDWIEYAMAASGSNRSYFRADWIWTGTAPSSYSTSQFITDWHVRFSGNDISHRKMLEMETFLAAGHPVVAERYLYNLEQDLIDKTSYIYQFVCTYKESKGTWSLNNTDRPGFDCDDCKSGMPHQENKSAAGWAKVYSTANVAAVSEVVDFRNKVKFESVPTLFEGYEYEGEELPQYLDAIGGSVRLPFVWTIDDSNNDWKYKIYVDMNGDLKFGDNEVINEGNAYADMRLNDRYALLSSSVPGPVQWKIEVYRNSNPAERYVKTGFSAISAKQTDGGKKEGINVLQIMPTSDGKGGGDGFLQMDEKGSYFQSLLKSLQDYNVNVTSITFADYWKCFPSTNKFEYNTELGTSNVIDWEVKNKAASGIAHPLDYDVIVVGFEDSSGALDLQDLNGAVQFLWYWADQGRGILFTHDLSSMQISVFENGASNNKRYIPNTNVNEYGATVSNLLRDVMGMNRYGAISVYAGAAGVKNLWYYQKNQKDSDSDGVHYDWIAGDGKVGTQGYTYVSMFMFGSGTHLGLASANQKWLYKSLPAKANSTSPGINLNHWLSKTVSQVNEGQVTVYPYKIDLTENEFTGRKEMQVALTHMQYYQLNPEDEDVIVWYALSKNDNAQFHTYEVSPNDGINNYYIYSKKNVFYSGVGHSTANEKEQRLLVNVLIAAYKAGKLTQSYVEVKDAEMVETDAGVNRAYEIKQIQNYADSFLDGDDQFLYRLNEDDIDSAPLDIIFTPRDFNPYADNLECVIAYEYTDKNGHTHREDITQYLTGAENDYGKISEVEGGRKIDLSGPVSNQGLVIGTGEDAFNVGKVFVFNNEMHYCLSLNREILYKIKPKTQQTGDGSDFVDVDSRRIIFYLRNEITPTVWTKTTVDISILPLFLLE